jgi:Domain of unknown function (DUF4282)
MWRAKNAPHLAEKAKSLFVPGNSARVLAHLKEARMPEAKGMWEGLMDFSFRIYATPKMLKFLYALHLLVGLVAAVAWVVLAFQQAPVQGLLALLAAVVGYCFWILYCRVLLEVLAAIFRMAAAIAPERTTTEHQ